MSLDYKVLEVNSNDLNNEDIKWRFLDYSQIRVTDGGMDLYNRLINFKSCEFYEESCSINDELRVFDSRVYKKKDLIEFLESQESSNSRNELLDIIHTASMDYIILQVF